MDYAFEQTDNAKKKVMDRINGTILRGYNRCHVTNQFYKIWEDEGQDSFWIHRYEKNFMLQNENCVKCGNYRETLLHNILCICPEFVELYSELEV
jgi:ribosomal protein S14